MKKSYLIIGIVFALLLGINIYQNFTKVSLVYVDVNKLIDGYHKTKSSKADFNKKTDMLKANSDSLTSSWQQELKKYEQERSTLSPKELQLKQELLANRQQQINSYQEALQQQISEEDKQITQTLINDINDYVKEYGKLHGYKIIFGASGGGNIMYADEDTDLTEDVLNGLNAKYDKK